ncbi:hypothetical protein DMN91_007761, partial [Ooceraea biroi]
MIRSFRSQEGRLERGIMGYEHRVMKICILYMLSVIFAVYAAEDVEMSSGGDERRPAKSRPVNL